jgi:hypothetical protein
MDEARIDELDAAPIASDLADIFTAKDRGTTAQSITNRRIVV